VIASLWIAPDIKEGARVDALFAAAERLITNGPPSSSADEGGAIDLEQLRANVLSELLAADAAEREDSDDRRRLQTAAERAQWPDLVGVPRGGREGDARRSPFRRRVDTGQGAGLP
jgi:hypothetical protein